MANPNPDQSGLQPWQPGRSGNPAGYSRGRRISDAVAKLIDEKGLDTQFALTWIAMALGDKKALKDRKPEFAWFRELLDRLEGKVPDRVDVNAGQESPTEKARDKLPPRRRRDAGGTGD